MRSRDCFFSVWMGLAAAAVAAGGQDEVREVRLTVGESSVIDCPFDIGQISTTAPDVVDTVALSRREVLLLAKGYGLSTVGVWSKAGDRSFYKVTVAHDLGQVQDLLRRTFPDETIDVQSAQDALSLTGRVTSQIVADRAAALVTPLAKSVVNNLRVIPPGPEKQVMLRVRFAELNRTAASSFGLGLISTGAVNTIGRLTTGQFATPQPDEIGNTVSKFTISDALNVFAFRPDLDLAAFIQALQSQGVLQMLAEPNLVTTDGKEASFLVGGEFPVPVVQGGATSGAVTIQFREFGIRLTFQPQITPVKTIRLHVKPEVSMLDATNGVTLSGFRIPALSTRKMETNIELTEGQSFVIAGLMDDRATETLSKVPGLASIPVLGSLFKSRQENKTKTELVVIVTPVITDPAEAARLVPEPVMPMEFLQPPDSSGGPETNGKREP
jgi:pilus assembly protein CpaC